jgi:hypothetical protein
MIEILPPLGKYKYDTWRILPIKCYIDNSVLLQSYIRNVNSAQEHLFHTYGQKMLMDRQMSRIKYNPEYLYKVDPLQVI